MAEPILQVGSVTCWEGGKPDSCYRRKSARLRASTKEDLPWPARVQMVNGVPCASLSYIPADES